MDNANDELEGRSGDLVEPTILLAMREATRQLLGRQTALRGVVGMLFCSAGKPTSLGGLGREH